MKICKKCKQQKLLTDFPSSGYNTTNEGKRNKVYKPVCKPCLVDNMRENRDALWSKYFILKCSKCGYDKSRSALEVHHENGEDKKFTFANRWSISEATFAKEAENCIILCANCHREEHDRLRGQ